MNDTEIDILLREIKSSSISTENRDLKPELLSKIWNFISNARRELKIFEFNNSHSRENSICQVLTLIKSSELCDQLAIGILHGEYIDKNSADRYNSYLIKVGEVSVEYYPGLQGDYCWRPR